MNRRITADDRQVLAFLKQMEGQGLESPRVKGKSHAEKFFSGDGWQSVNSGYGTRGGFDGAQFDREMGDWNPGAVGPNRVGADTKIMRERARDLVNNNPYAAAAVDAYVSNVIERGIKPKPAFPEEDRRSLWETQWKIWGGLMPWFPGQTSQADITGVDTIYGLQALWLREIITAGGCILHFVELPRNPAMGRTIPLAIELIPEERIANNRDNFLFAAQAKTGNPIINGVEMDRATGKHLAYWVYPTIPGDAPLSSIEPIRLPAENCIYAFFRRRIGMNRGHTLLHAVITWLWRLGYYVSSEMFASNLKSQWAYVLTTEDDDQDFSMGQDEDVTCATDAFGNRLDKLVPGSIFRARGGEGIEAVGPNVPQGDSLPWIQLIERSIAAGVSISHVELTRDYSASNFSNTRAALNADRKRFRTVQDFTIANNCNPVWFQFVRVCCRLGLDGFPTPADFMSAPEDWLRVTHQTPGWATVNPKDDATADQTNLSMGATTLEEIASVRGLDWEALLEQRAREVAKAESLGINIAGSAPAPKPAPNPTDVNPDANPTGEPPAGSNGTEPPAPARSPRKVAA